MFGLFSKTARPQLAPRSRDQHGCFGKMPIHPDFIRHGVRAREVVGLESWVQEGMGLLSRSRHAGGEAFPEFPCHRLIMNGGEQERTLAGTVVFSRDRSGRRYPFVVFSLADEPLFRDMQAAVPLAFEEFFRRGEEIVVAPWSQEPVTQLIDQIEGIPSRDSSLTRRHLLERQIEMLGALPMGRFWQSALPGCPSAARTGLFDALFSALKSAARRGPGRITWGLRLPLPAGPDLDPSVVFWVQLIESILEDRSWRAHYFWHGAGADRPASLTLFFRPLAASLFLWLLPSNCDEAGLFDLRREMHHRSDVVSSPDLVRMYRDDDLSMLELLYRAGRREVLL